MHEETKSWIFCLAKTKDINSQIISYEKDTTIIDPRLNNYW